MTIKPVGPIRDHRYLDTDAARMLADAVRRAKDERGLSLRKIAPMVGYAQATVLSQMIHGHVKVPIGKAAEIANVLDIPQQPFVTAVMRQHHGEAEGVSTALQAGPIPMTDLGGSPGSHFASELEELADVPLDRLTPEQKEIMRKVAIDSNPARRWLSEAEIPMMTMVRQLRPDSVRHGLNAIDRARVMKALGAKES